MFRKQNIKQDYPDAYIDFNGDIYGRFNGRVFWMGNVGEIYCRQDCLDLLEYVQSEDWYYLTEEEESYDDESEKPYPFISDTTNIRTDIELILDKIGCPLSRLKNSTEQDRYCLGVSLS